MSLRRRILLLSSLLLLSQTLLAWHLPTHLQEQLAEDGAAFGITLSGDECSLSGHGAALPDLVPPAVLPPPLIHLAPADCRAAQSLAFLVPPARGPPAYA